MKQVSTGKVSIWQLSSILRLIYKHPGITRAELSSSLGINKSAITNLTGFLETASWIAGEQDCAKNVPLTLNPGRLNVAGVVFQPEFSTLVICDLSGAILFEKTWAEQTTDLENFLGVILPYRIHETGIRVDALGVALPGIVDETTGTLLASKPLGVEKPQPLPDRIGAKDFPVFYCNDARCIGWGRISFAREAGNFFLHYLSFAEHDPPTEEFARIIHGSSLFVDGAAFGGSNHCAGELRIKSHLAFAGSGELYFDHQTRLQMKSNPGVMEKYLDALAFNIAYVSTLMDVEKVFLFGSLERYGSSLAAKISDFAKKISYYPALQGIVVEYPGFTERTVPLGAAGMAIERLFSVPSADRPTAFYRALLGEV